MDTSPTTPVLDVSSLADLEPDDRNPNHGTARGRDALAHSLQEYGVGRSILIDRCGRVLAGNKVLAEARALELPATVIRTTGGALVVVQRTDLDLQRAAARGGRYAFAESLPENETGAPGA